MFLSSLFDRIRTGLRKRGERFLILILLLLVGALSFEGGLAYSAARESDEPLVISLPAAPLPAESKPVAGGEPAPKLSGVEPAVSASSSREGCAFVGSRNSDLYHLPHCAPAKRIKPENLVCFASAEDAVQKGYRPGCLK